MESHALWDSYSASRAEYDASGPSFSGYDGQISSASAPAPTEPSGDAVPDYAATFLRNLGFADLGDEGGSVKPLKELNGHLREFNQLRHEVEMLRQQRHEDALKVAGLDARVAMLEQRLAEEVRESGRLQNTLDGVLAEHRTERSRTLREMTDLKKLAARLKGLDSNHLANYRRLEVDHDKLRDKLAKVQKAPAPAVASKSGAKGAAAGAAANPSSSTRGVSVTEPLPLQQPPKEWSAVTVAEAAAAQARVALLLQENAKLTEALRGVKEEVSDLVAGAESLEAAAASAKALREAAEASTQQTKEGNSRGGEAGPSGADDVVATAASSNPSELAMPASWVCDHVAGPLQGELEDLKARIQTHFAASKSREDDTKEEATNTGGGGESLVFGDGEGSTLLKAAESRAAELAKRLAAAESIILEQDQLVYAALFSTGGGGASHGGRNSQGGGWDGDASFEAELNEERVWLATREQALASKENELSEAAVALDLDRLKLEAFRVNGQHWSHSSSSSSASSTPRRPRSTVQTPSSKQKQQPMASPMLARTPGWRDSPISLQVPTTPATAQVLKDMGIRVKVSSEGTAASPSGAPPFNAFLSPTGPSP